MRISFCLASCLVIPAKSPFDLSLDMDLIRLLAEFDVNFAERGNKINVDPITYLRWYSTATLFLTVFTVTMGASIYGK